ncbi:hypothetical protein [Iodobacter fluviatilis]|uniref:hypothetical protein n=1 Tax=Iodobacter fluviatilis TaxID=537 RepID=UPI00101F8910|nr:hypothetical protein [Iodobacter fluviatilis]
MLLNSHGTQFFHTPISGGFSTILGGLHIRYVCHVNILTIQKALSCMRKLFVVGVCSWSAFVSAAEYATPTCYENIPTSCSFNEMTLSLCNKEGKSKKVVFLLSQRIHIPSGNKFNSADGSKFCTVQGIKGTDPKRYTVVIK